MRKQLILMFFGIIVLMGVVSASLEIRIDVNPSFDVGETVRFDYSFISDIDEEIIYTPRIKCINLGENLLEDRSANLEKGVLVKGYYEGVQVTDEINPQQCLAVIKIKEPFIQVKEEIFEIKRNSVFLFNFNINLCKDSSCIEKSKIFLKNKEVYLDYSSSVENPSITAILTYPDKTTKEITLPGLIKASQIGSYELDVSASKESYKTVNKKEQFGVIEGNANIKDVSVKDLGIRHKKFLEGVKGNSWFVIFIIASLIVVVVILIFLFRKRK